MSNQHETDASATVTDVGEFCRQVEDHLTRANAGHLIRIVGPGFALVRQWAEEGVPLRIVFSGIDAKVERHRAGNSRRPLRIEFCEDDVRAIYEQWRRAVGLTTTEAPATSVDPDPAAAAERRRPSLSKHLDRALERLARAAGRLDLPDRFRDGVTAAMAEVAAVRDAARTARGDEREALTARAVTCDRELLTLARETAPADMISAARHDAERDLAGYRMRLSGDGWARALDATIDQLLRDRLGLPTLEP